MEINLGFALLLTVLAGLSTGIGSAIAFFIRRPKYSYLSFLLGLSAGVMVYISFTELLGTAIGRSCRFYSSGDAMLLFQGNKNKR